MSFLSTLDRIQEGHLLIDLSPRKESGDSRAAAILKVAGNLCVEFARNALVSAQGQPAQAHD